MSSKTNNTPNKPSLRASIKMVLMFIGLSLLFTGLIELGCQAIDRWRAYGKHHHQEEQTDMKLDQGGYTLVELITTICLLGAMITIVWVVAHFIIKYY